MSMLGFTRNFSPLKILTEEQLEVIHRGALNVLEKTGLRIEHERALKLFEENGCRVDYDDRRVRIPPGVVEECMRRCPSSFHLKARNPKNDMILGGNTVYFGPFPGMQTVDFDTWEPRAPTREEFYDGVTVLDALENLHYIHTYSPWFGFEGLPPVMCIPEGFAAEARNSTKVLRSASSKDCEIFIIEMAKAVGTDAPVSCCVSAPLTYYAEAVEASYRAIEADFPVFVTGGAIMGGHRAGDNCWGDTNQQCRAVRWASAGTAYKARGKSSSPELPIPAGYAGRGSCFWCYRGFFSQCGI